MSMGVGQLRQSAVSAIGQLSVMLVGIAYIWFEPLTLRLTEDPYYLTSDQVSWVVSIIEVGGTIGSVVAGNLVNRIGRKIVIFSAGPLCFLGWFIIIFSKTYMTLIVVRLIHGFTVGAVFTVTPIYTAEIADPNLRGKLCGGMKVAWHVGNLYTFIIGHHLSYNNFVYACLPLPVFFMVTYWFCPESPYYLLMKGRTEEAREALLWFRATDKIDAEFTSMQEAIEEEMKSKSSWRKLLFDKAERNAFIIVEIVITSKYLSGYSVIISYATEIISKGESFLLAAETPMILGVVFTFIAVVSAFLSDSIGRKPLVLISCYGCFLANLLTGTYYYLHERSGVNMAPYVWMLYIGLSCFCFFFGIGLGPLSQTLQAEMFGATTRGLAGMITQLLGFGLSFAVLKGYTWANEAFGIYFNFLFYSLAELVGGLLLNWLMFETSGKTIGRIKEKENSQVT